jgi:hypothetical protein
VSRMKRWSLCSSTGDINLPPTTRGSYGKRPPYERSGRIEPTALLRYSSNAFHRFLLTWRCACSPGSLVTAQTRAAAAVLLQCQPMTQEGMCLRAGYYLLVQPCFSANRTGLVLVHCRMTDSDPPDVLISHCGNAPG